MGHATKSNMAPYKRMPNRGMPTLSTCNLDVYRQVGPPRVLTIRLIHGFLSAYTSEAMF